MSRASKKSVTLGGLRDQLDDIEAKLDALAKLLQRLAPNETKSLPSQIVATGAFGHGSANLPVRSYPTATPIVDKNLGAL